MKKRSEVARALDSGVVVPLDLWPVPPELAGIALGGADLLAEDDGRNDFVVEGLIEREDLVLVVGREKDSAKTFLALDLAVSRVVGGPWLGFDVQRAPSGRVLFVSCETSARQIARRLRALRKGRGIDAMRVAAHLLVVDRPISMVPRAMRDRTANKSQLSALVSAAKMPDAERRRALRASADTIAEREVDALGQNLDALAAIEDAPEGTWTLIIIDTVRECLVGDESSSEDAAAFSQAARELARAAGCPLVAIHHTSKAGAAGDARAARGSTQLTASPDAIITIDTSGETLTANFRLRNHAAPDARGYALVPGEDGAIRIEPRAASKSTVDAGDVLALLQEHAPDALTVTKIRTLLSGRRGGKSRSKVAPGPVEDALAQLAKSGQVTKVDIETRGKTLAGWRAGTDSRPDTGKQIGCTHSGAEAFFGDPGDVCKFIVSSGRSPTSKTPSFAPRWQKPQSREAKTKLRDVCPRADGARLKICGRRLPTSERACSSHSSATPWMPQSPGAPTRSRRRARRALMRSRPLPTPSTRQRATSTRPLLCKVT